MNADEQKTPAMRARDTAREQAREQGRSVREDEMRCIKIKGMSAWAKLLFWILSKICWEKSPFLHRGQVGSVCITGRQLQQYFGFPQKRLYSQNKKRKDKEGNVISTRTVPGAIEEIELAGLVWMSRKQIDNIPAAKWPNVFNLTAVVSQRMQSNLNLLEGISIVEDDRNEVRAPNGGSMENGHATHGGSSDFSAQSRGGSGQTPQKGLGKHQRGDLAATNGGSGQAPHAGVGKNQRGELATTNGGSSGATNGGSSVLPTGGVGRNQRGEQPNPAGGASKETSDGSMTVNDSEKTVNRLRNRNRSGEPMKRKKGEEDFLERIAVVLGREELHRNGGLWITNYRANPETASSVIAEVKLMQREGRIKCSAAKAAMDLWRRWK